MADLGAIGEEFIGIGVGSTRYDHYRGAGTLSGNVTQNAVAVTALVMLIDPKNRLLIDSALGTSYSFAGLSTTHELLLLVRNLASSTYNDLVFARVKAA